MTDGAQRFYAERVPEQFNRALEETLRTEGEEGDKYKGLVAVHGTIEVRVDGVPGSPFHLNIDAGRMTSGDHGSHEPFLILLHDAATCEALERESGDSALGFLGGMAGLDQEIRLTQPRIDKLRQVNGTVRLTLDGPGGFSLCAHFGGGTPGGSPDCELVIDSSIYGPLRSGEIDPQEAFMSGKIEIDGDMQIAMQLALAMMSPD